jgi:hypothetical protein
MPSTFQMKSLGVTMYLKVPLMLILATLIVFGHGGCGGLSEADMRQLAIRRPKDDESSSASSVPASGSASARQSPMTETPQKSSGSESPSRQVKPATTDSAEGVQPTATSVRESKLEPDTIAPPATPLMPEECARRTVENLTRIGDAFKAYLEDKRVYPRRAVFDHTKQPLLSWRVAILPYLGYRDLYSEFRLNEPWNSPHNRNLLAKIPAVYQSPERFDDRTNYLLPIDSATIFALDRGVPPLSVEDRPENTVFVLEVDDSLAVPWTEPRDYPLNLNAPTRDLGTLRGDSFYVVWGNGQVGRVLTSAPARYLRAMYTYDGNEDFAAGKIDQPLLPEPANPPAVLAAAGVESGGRQTGSDPSNSRSAPQNEALRPLSASYLERSAEEARQGAEREAALWFYAAAIVSPQGSDWPRRYRWAPALRRPTPTLRFGIGLKYAGRRQPELQQAIQTSSLRGLRSRKSPLTTATGEVGEELVRALSEHAATHGGELLHAEPMVQEASARRTAPRTEQSPLLKRSSLAMSLAPGVSFLAMDQEPVLRALARREEIDVLVFVEWRDAGRRQSFRLELIDPARDQTVFQLPWIENTDVSDGLTNPLKTNPLPERFQKLTDFLHEQLAAVDLPAQLKPEHVQGRLDALATAEPDNPLRTLAEMRFYRERGLADDTQLLLAYQTLLGQQEGSELFLGDAATRERVLKAWLPAAAKQSTNEFERNTD